MADRQSDSRQDIKNMSPGISFSFGFLRNPSIKSRLIAVPRKPNIRNKKLSADCKFKYFWLNKTWF